MVQQVHLHDGLLGAHGLDGEVLGAHHVELLLLSDLKGILRRSGGEGIGPQALGQAGLILEDLALDIAHSAVDGAAHIAVRRLRLGTEQSISSADRHFNAAAMILFHRKGDKGVCLLPEKAIQLGQLLRRVVLDGIIQSDLLARECKLHTTAPFVGPLPGSGKRKRIVSPLLNPSISQENGFEKRNSADFTKISDLPQGAPCPFDKSSVSSPKAPMYKKGQVCYNHLGSFPKLPPAFGPPGALRPAASFFAAKSRSAKRRSGSFRC